MFTVKCFKHEKGDYDLRIHVKLSCIGLCLGSRISKFIRLTSRGSAPTEWKKMNFFSVTFPDVFILAMVIDINGDPPGEGIDIHIKNVPLFD